MSFKPNEMNWYYKALGGHTHVRVYMNGAKCGDLCFRNQEFADIRTSTCVMMGGVKCNLINEAEEPRYGHAPAAALGGEDFNSIEK